MEELNAAERGNARTLRKLNPKRGEILKWHAANQQRKVDNLMEELRQEAIQEGRLARRRPLESIMENERNNNNNNNYTRSLKRSQRIVNTEMNLGRLRATSRRKGLLLSRRRPKRPAGRGTERKHVGNRGQLSGRRRV